MELVFHTTGPRLGERSGQPSTSLDVAATVIAIGVQIPSELGVSTGGHVALQSIFQPELRHLSLRGAPDRWN